MFYWMIFGYAHALDCSIDPSLISAGTQEKGFSSDVFQQKSEEWIQAKSIYPLDTIKAHASVEGFSEGEELQIHWESSLNGVLQSQSLAGYSQLWYSGLQVGVHRLTLRIRNQGGEECSDTIALRVEAYPLQCSFEGYAVKGEQRDFFVLESESPAQTPLEANIQYIGDIQTLDVSLRDKKNGQQYPVQPNVDGEIHTLLPPHTVPWEIELYAKAPSGQECRVDLLLIRQEEPTKASKKKNRFSDGDSVGFVYSGLGLHIQTGWGGRPIFAPQFDFLSLRSITQGLVSYKLGVEGGIFGRDTYGMFALQGQLAVVNGLSIGNLHLLSGLGAEYLDVAQINFDTFSETRIAEDALISFYARNEVLLNFSNSYALRGGFTPRWYMHEVEQNTANWDTWGWHVGIHAGVFHVEYAEQYFEDRKWVSFQASFGYAFFD